MPTPFVLKLEYGATLSDQDRQVLEQAVRDVRQFGPRHDLILEDDSPENVHVILEGFACRYKLLPDGTRQIMAYLVPGDCCDLHVPILSKIDHTIGTLTACKVALLPHTMIEDLTAHSRTITRALWWSTLADQGTLREWLVNMSRRPADKRLAHLLCELLVRLQAVGLATDNSFGTAPDATATGRHTGYDWGPSQPYRATTSVRRSDHAERAHHHDFRCRALDDVCLFQPQLSAPDTTAL